MSISDVISVIFWVYLQFKIKISFYLKKGTGYDITVKAQIKKKNIFKRITFSNAT